MVNHLINMLILTAGQWSQFGDAKYEQQFELLLLQLQKATGKNREQAIQMLLEVVEGESAA